MLDNQITGADDFYKKSQVKRETGVSPVRSRHCIQGMQNHVCMHSHWETGKTIRVY